MSDLSLVHGEYKRLSALLKDLDEALIVAQSSALKLENGGCSAEAELCSNLKVGLESIRDDVAVSGGEKVGSENSIAEALVSMPTELQGRIATAIPQIAGKLPKGLRSLSSDDLDLLSALGSTLDRATAILFRRMHQR
jgi:hypothetical protein